MAGGAMFDEFVQTGLLDDADVVVLRARFEQWDYRGKQAPVLALGLDLLDLRDPEAKVVDEHLSAGDLKFFVPSADGKQAMPCGAQLKLNINTNAAAFIISLMNADARQQMATKLKGSDDISIIEGMALHIKRKDQPKRPGIAAPEHAAAPGAAPDRPRQQLIVTAVHTYPGENGDVQAAFVRGQQMIAARATAAPVAPMAASPFAAPVAAAPVHAPAPPISFPASAPVPAAAPSFAAPTAAPAAAAPAVTGDPAVVAAAANVLLRMVAAGGGSVKKSMIAGKVFTDDEMKTAAMPLRNAVLGMIVQPTFLASEAVTSMGMKYDPTSESVTFAQ